MSEKKIISEENIARVRDLLRAMEKDDESGAQEVLDDLTDIRESILYKEMGKLTRELHDAISAFGMDDRITDIAEHEIPDARQRLNYVISKTDEAANKTLTAIEATTPLCQRLAEETADLKDKWLQFTRRELDAGQFRALSKDLITYFEARHSDSEQIKEHLNNVLMAQDFQDLTGQIIKKVITLAGEVEANLVNLIKLAGLPEHVEHKRKEDELAGPIVPGVDTGDTVSGQDEVDDLLSSLGF